MTNQTLRNNFLKALNESRSFQLLTKDEQKEIRQLYETASDDELRKALVELQNDQQNTTEIIKKLEENEKKAIELAKLLKEDVQHIEKQELKTNIANDKHTSEVEAEKILALLEDE